MPTIRVTSENGDPFGEIEISDGDYAVLYADAEFAGVTVEDLCRARLIMAALRDAPTPAPEPPKPETPERHLKLVE